MEKQTQTRQHEERLDAAVAEILKAEENGSPLSHDAWLSRYPDLAGELKDYFASREQFDQLALPLRTGEGRTAADVSGDDVEHLRGLLGDFRIVREVGRGGMGVVYEAEQLSLRRRVALKVLPFAATLDPRHLQRFKNEALAAAALDHPHIVKVYAVGQERGVHYFAMQFIDGQTVAEFIRQQKQASATDARTKTGRSTVLATGGTAHGKDYFDHVARLGMEAALALEHAHQVGIVHRDIKPGNLMLDGQGKLWITDFGLARNATGSALTGSGDLLGTLRYMAPEQALAKHGVVDHRADIYSLGVTLYELVTLQPAFAGDDAHELVRQFTLEEPVAPRKLNRAIPADLETILCKAMARDAADRYATAVELAEDLRRFRQREPIKARRPTLLHRTKKWLRRHLAALWSLFLLVITAAVLVNSGATIFMGGSHSKSQTETHERAAGLHARDDGPFISPQTAQVDEVPMSLKHFDPRHSTLKKTAGRPTPAAGAGKKKSFLPVVEPLEDRTVPSAVFVVTSTADTVNAADGVLTLREAILDANATVNDGGPDAIHFNIPTTDPGYDAATGTFTIRPATGLGVTDNVVIDGYTQPGASPNTLADGNNAVLKVVLNGEQNTEHKIGLWMMSAGTVRGLVINGFAGAGFASEGIRVSGPGVVIEGNFIGTDAAGMAAASNGLGVLVESGVADTLIGGTSPAARNVISANNNAGVVIHGLTANTRVQGNFVGTDASGTAALGNGALGWQGTFGFGIGVVGAHGNAPPLIGGTEAGARNVVSGNLGYGIGGPATIQGNFVGTDVTGTKALGNAWTGILGGGIIGGTAPGAGNVISGNRGPYQVESGGTIQGNFIGTDVTGTKALGHFDSLFVGSGLIGGTDPAARNVISGTVRVHATLGHGAVIQGNYIGLDVTGTALLHPDNDFLVGVYLLGVHDVLIGGSQPGAGNVIAGFTYNILFEGASHNRVQGNFIGTDAHGQQIPGGYYSGIGVALGGTGNLVGSDGDGLGDQSEGNLIAFHSSNGVNSGAANAANVVRGNSIHSNGGLGIDRGLTGVTTNDDETDDIQNFPVLDSVSGGATTRVTGTLHSLPNASFILDFYANAQADPSGHGEGQRWLGSATVTTDGNGDVSFDVTLQAASAAGEFLTATATWLEDHDSDATTPLRATDTSEFSAVREITIPIQQVTIDVRDTVNLQNEGVLQVTLFSTSDFDAALVDVGTVVFAGAFAVHHAYEDANGDGLLDLVLHFRTQDTNLRAVYEQLLAADSDSNQQETAVTLTGETVDGVFVEGTDELNIFLSGQALRDLLEDLASRGVI